MKKLSVVLLVGLLVVLSTGVAGAKVIRGWEPALRTSVDLQVATYGQFGYQPPVTNIYGNETVYVNDSMSQWNYGDYTNFVSQSADTIGETYTWGYYEDWDDDWLEY